MQSNFNFFHTQTILFGSCHFVNKKGQSGQVNKQALKIGLYCGAKKYQGTSLLLPLLFLLKKNMFYLHLTTSVLHLTEILPQNFSSR
jgi:hypothetical protein